MTELIEQYLRLGLVHFMASPETMADESLLLPSIEKVAHDPAFRCIELKLIEDEKLLEPVRQLATSAMLGLGLAAQPAILAGHLNPGSGQAKERKAVLDLLKRHVDQALALGAETVALLSGPDPGAEKRHEALLRTAELIAELCRYSRGHSGPAIVLEVFDREGDKKALVGPAESVVQLCEMVNSRGAVNFGVCVDLSHLPLLGETPHQALEPVQDYLLTAHLGNAVLQKGHALYGDRHPGFGTPEGANKVDQTRDFLHVLKNIGFLNRKNPPMVSFEIKPAAGEKSETVIAAAHRVLRRAWAKA